MFALPDPRHSDSVLQMSRNIWPQDGNPFFWKNIQMYTLFLEDLVRTITKIILASLDLDAENYYQSDFQNCTSILRIIYYTCDRKSLDEDPLFHHTDGGMFTFLYQDNKGRLQIRSKEGMWLNVKPLSNSFLINIGDSYKAWTKGTYRSVEHRVVYTGWADRISLGHFVYFPSDKDIRPPHELVDDQHPRRYRPFRFYQFKQYYIERQNSEEKKATFIERYAGV